MTWSLRLTVPDKIPSFFYLKHLPHHDQPPLSAIPAISRCLRPIVFCWTAKSMEKPFSGARIDVLYQQD